MAYGYSVKEWKDPPEEARLSIQKKAHAAWRIVKGWFEGTLKKKPYVRGFREDGFKVIKDK